MLVDPEPDRVVDLLPGREAATVAAWLRERPDVECAPVGGQGEAI